MSERILICTDLDRTLLPNGTAAESPQARPLFSALVSRANVSLAYVSGRHKELVEEAIAEYQIPQPDFVIGDVGTSLYEVGANAWHASEAWANEIAPDWAGRDHAYLRQLLAPLSGLTLQEEAKQNRFKLSFYTRTNLDIEPLLMQMRKLLVKQGVNAELIFSVDEAKQVGLLDVLPASATKYHAVEFLMKQLGLELNSTVFAGDSGNDLPVLVSPIFSVLVANASNEVRDEATRLAEEQGTADALYLAKGHFMGMNGNYSAGILEGVAHFLPHTKQWMQLDD
ncbi:MAG: HAD-IIB family hydrolase [Gammaproteobacteria bacterium]